MDDGGSQMRPEEDVLERKLAEMRTALTAQDVSLQGIDDSMLLRFLRARAMQVPPASKMLAEEQAWRTSFVPLGFIPESQIQNELAQGKAYLQGVSEQTGCPLLIMVARHHVPNRTDFQEFKRFVVYTLEKTIASAPAGVEKYGVVVDLEGLRYKNMDIRSLISGLQLLQNYYPERLARLIFVKAPYIFASFWKVASPLVDKVTREKINILDGQKTSGYLIEEFGANVIPKMYGGKAEMILIQDAHVPNWPPRSF